LGDYAAQSSSFEVGAAVKGMVTFRAGSVVCISRQWLPEIRETAKPAFWSARMTSRALIAGNRSLTRRA
jgi:hypothetical protein